MSSIEITFSNPWMLLLAIPSLAIVLIPFYRLPKKRRSTAKRILPVVLHVVIVLFLVLILSGFSFIRTSDEQAVVLLMDFSGSTKTVQDEIEARAQEIQELLDKRTPISVVAFAKNQVYSVDSKKIKIEVSATNIDEALTYAATLLPEDKVGRIIILSDGKQNEGDADSTAHYLATQGIRIDAMYFDTTDLKEKEVQISSLSVQEGAYVGEELVFTVDIRTNYDGNVKVSFSDDKTILETRDVPIVTGSNLCEFRIKAETPKVHDFQLRLEAENDAIEENNESSVAVNILEKPSVLIIANMYSDTFELEELLESEYEVTAIRPSKTPTTIEELCKYDQIILSNADYEDFPQGSDKLFQSYVSEYGRSILFAGGGETFMYGHMEGTALEEIMPVSLTLSEDTEAKSVALMLVLDCSSSMSRRSTYLSVAKQGAIKCVDAMTSNDMIGVVSFNRVAVLNSPLIQATDTNKKSLTQLISRLGTSGGTFYTEALQKAHAELQKSTADIKHVIFLSDGSPSDHDFYSAVSAMATDGITVSAIGLGYTSGILTSLAEMGGGRYYYVENAQSLPDIMLSETEQVVVSSLKRGEFKPVITEPSELTDAIGNTQLPILSGYLGTTLKDDATAYITTEDGNPLYAEWTYGAGKVGCFTSDLKAMWSQKWFESGSGQTVIKNMSDTMIGEYLERLNTVFCQPEYDAFAESGEGLLHDICNYSEGNIYKSTEKLATASVAEKTTVLNPMEILGILSAILLLTDVAIRKLRWKDIKNIWMKLQKGTR